MNSKDTVHDLLVEKGVLYLQNVPIMLNVLKILFNGAGDTASSAVKELALQA